MSIASNGGLVRVPHPVPVRDQTVFHYTNAAGLIGIVQSHTLWASSVLALNDLSEMRYGIEVIAEAISGRSGQASGNLREMLEREDFAGLARDSYVISASADGDSLSQWVGYAGNLGYAIELDTGGDIERVDKMQITSGQPIEALGGLFPGASDWWYPVMYGHDQQLTKVNEILDVLEGHGFVDPAYLYHPIGVCIATFKNRAFASEREVRFISGRSSDGRDKFRPGRYGVVPYAEVSRPKDQDKHLPIKSVVIGPLNSDERPSAEAIVRALLDTNGYHQAEVRSSSVPYRF